MVWTSQAASSSVGEDWASGDLEQDISSLTKKNLCCASNIHNSRTGQNESTVGNLGMHD